MNLKFRAWNTFEKKMYKVGQLTLDKLAGWSFEPCIRSKTVDVSVPTQPYVKIMQSSGLVDKDGNEIFEGDVLLSVASDNPRDHKKWIVSYEDGGFICDFKYTPKDRRKRHLHEIEPLCADNIYFYKFKVIGNIYENPELLKQDI